RRSIWRRRGGRPAIGTEPEEVRAFLRLVLEKAGLPPLKILLKLLSKSRRKPRRQKIYTLLIMNFARGKWGR
ncbi:MAG: hypothetical protein ACP5SQ_11250, partial [Candidatus Saccharicenans sp.]